MLFCREKMPVEPTLLSISKVDLTFIVHRYVEMKIVGLVFTSRSQPRTISHILKAITS